jgi:hypothetical protein
MVVLTRTVPRIIGQQIDMNGPEIVVVELERQDSVSSNAFTAST